MTTYTITETERQSLITGYQSGDDGLGLIMLLRNLQPNTQEPALHQFQSADGTWHPFLSEQHYVNTKADGRWPMRALYVHPATQKPLTDEQIESLWDTWLTSKYGAVTKAEALVFARLIEAAHGVKP